MITQYHKYWFIFIGTLIFSVVNTDLTWAQSASEQAAEQREFEHERRQEELEELRNLPYKPKSAEEVLKMLKKRAKEKIEEQQAEYWRQQIRKTRISAGVTVNHDTNPASASNDPKSDTTIEENVSLKWVPTFNKTVSGNFGWSATNTMYMEQRDLGTLDNTFNADVTFKTFGGKLNVAPGIKWQSNHYPEDDSASYFSKKTYLNLTHYFSKLWNFGGKYEYQHKWYDNKKARNELQTDLDFVREDFRHTVELWAKRFIGAYNVKFKAKSFRNKSNDEYQDFNDYDSHKFEIQLAGTILKNIFKRGMYTSFTYDYEAKHYFTRLAETTARWDHTNSYRLNTNYTISPTWSLSYTFTQKYNNSNATTGVYESRSNKLALTGNF